MRLHIHNYGPQIKVGARHLSRGETVCANLSDVFRTRFKDFAHQVIIIGMDRFVYHIGSKIDPTIIDTFLETHKYLKMNVSPLFSIKLDEKYKLQKIRTNLYTLNSDINDSLVQVCKERDVVLPLILEDNREKIVVIQPGDAFIQNINDKQSLIKQTKEIPVEDARLAVNDEDLLKELDTDIADVTDFLTPELSKIPKVIPKIEEPAPTVDAVEEENLTAASIEDNLDILDKPVEIVKKKKVTKKKGKKNV